ncbi:hypothetical protein GGE65_008174 [Skermanella aerolata]|uniref:helix-turn-helix domain-containing protein n=1 Tax=Skermanella aerolata TaxID=393310 RepID=UPI003D253F7B
MSALIKTERLESKKERPEHLWGGNKMGFLAARACHLTGDETKLLMLLLHHLGEEGCFPSQETLMMKAGWSQRKLRRVRDALAAKGEIDYVSGTGHKSTRYSIPDLISWTAEQAAKLKPKTAPKVPGSATQGLPPGGTEHLNTSFKRKTPPPDLQIVPTQGWAAVVYHAPEMLKEHWLPHVELVSEGPEGVRLKSTQSHHADRIRKELMPGGALHQLAKKAGLNLDNNPDSIRIEAPPCGTTPLLPATVPLSAKGQNQMADRIAAKWDGRIEPVACPTGSNVVHFNAYCTKFQPFIPEDDDQRS